MIRIILRPLTFLIAHFFTIAFLVALLGFSLTPIGKKVGGAVVRESKKSMATLPQKAKRIFAGESYSEKMQGFVKSGAQSTARGASGALHAVSYYVGYVATIALVFYLLLKFLI